MNNNDNIAVCNNLRPHHPQKLSRACPLRIVVIPCRSSDNRIGIHRVAACMCAIMRIEQRFSVRAFGYEGGVYSPGGTFILGSP